MMDNLVFVGGIHGVGKGTICKRICELYDYQHLTASEVLKWGDFVTDITSKLVPDINETQYALYNNLKSIVQSDKQYILDGHFCLFNKNGEVTPIKSDLFIKIHPKSLLLIINGNLGEVKRNIEIRDSNSYQIETLEKMQIMEIKQARRISSELNISLDILDLALVSETQIQQCFKKLFSNIVS